MKNTNLFGMVAIVVALVAGLATLGPATIRLALEPSSSDRDQDNVADSVESELCDRALTANAIAAGQVGRCVTANDWLPPNVAQRVFLPSTVMLGPDLDGDGLPSAVEIHGSDLVINPFSTTPVSLLPASSRWVDVDKAPYGDDKNKESPVLSTAAVPIPIPLGIEELRDGDRDDLPSAVQIKMVYLTVDRTMRVKSAATFQDAPDVTVPIDTRDDDPASPAQDRVAVSYVPTDVWHDGDKDDDLVPHALTVQYVNVTVDRRVAAKESRTSATPSSLTQVLDGDDASRDNVVRWSVIDKDADRVPDEVEFVFCLIERGSEGTDGRCDASREDYTPPTGSTNPWKAPTPA